MSDEQQLAILNPDEVNVEFQGETITITSVCIGNMQQFIAALRPIRNDIMMALDGDGDLLTTIELHGNRIIEAVHFATDIPIERLKKCKADEFLKLVAAVVEVNYDFFVKRLLPEMKKAVRSLVERANTDGTTQSSA